MKKLGKLSLKELKQEMPILGSDEQKKFYGGTTTDVNGVVWYSQAEMDAAQLSGAWGGGFVEGMGYVM